MVILLRSLSKEGCSIRATAKEFKEFKVHRLDVRQALACAIPPERKSAPKAWHLRIDGACVVNGGSKGSKEAATQCNEDLATARR
jgi:hypothetical protein